MLVGCLRRIGRGASWLVLRGARLLWPPAWTQEDMEVCFSLVAIVTFFILGGVFYMFTGDSRMKDASDLDLSDAHREQLIQDLIKEKGWQLVRDDNIYDDDNIVKVDKDLDEIELDATLKPRFRLIDPKKEKVREERLKIEKEKQMKEAAKYNNDQMKWQRENMARRPAIQTPSVNIYERYILPKLKRQQEALRNVKPPMPPDRALPPGNHFKMAPLENMDANVAPNNNKLGGNIDQNIRGGMDSDSLIKDRLPSPGPPSWNNGNNAPADQNRMAGAGAGELNQKMLDKFAANWIGEKVNKMEVNHGKKIKYENKVAGKEINMANNANREEINKMAANWIAGNVNSRDNDGKQVKNNATRNGGMMALDKNANNKPHLKQKKRRKKPKVNQEVVPNQERQDDKVRASDIKMSKYKKVPKLVPGTGDPQHVRLPIPTKLPTDSNFKMNLNNKKVAKSKRQPGQLTNRRSNVKNVQLNKPSKMTDIAVENMHIYDITQYISADYHCMHLNIKPSTVVCLYPVYQDVHVSYHIIEEGIWEPHIVKEMQVELYGNPNVGLIDIGANIGLYTLIAAKMGHNVVAIEPYIENIKHLHVAAKMNNVLDKITLLKNAVSDERRKLKLELPPDNQGGVAINKGEDCTPGASCHETDTLLMDDLAGVIPFKEAIIKIDIEGHEHKAFRKAAKLFDKIYIRSVYMEWRKLRSYYGAEITDTEDKTLTFELVGFLMSRDYAAYSHVTGARLKPGYWYAWPDDIVWKHQLSDVL